MGVKYKRVPKGPEDGWPIGEEECDREAAVPCREEATKSKGGYVAGFLLAVAISALTTVSLMTPKNTSIHGSYIAAYDTVTRQKLGPISEEEAHSKGVAHWATWVIVIDFSQEMILLQKRAKTVKTCPGAWSLSGEHLEPNETTVETAIRGLSEELSIEAKRDDLLMLENFMWRHRYRQGSLDVQNSTVYLYQMKGQQFKHHKSVRRLKRYRGASRTEPEGGFVSFPRDEESTSAELVPLSTFHHWCEEEPHRVCGRKFAKVYLKYLQSICSRVPQRTTFCRKYHRPHHAGSSIQGG